MQGRLAGLTALVVEDDPDTREVMRETLQRAGATVHVASTGAAACELFNQRRIDVVLTDYILPGGMNGFDILTKIRSSPVDGNVPVVGYSAHFFEVVPVGERAAFDTFVPKPAIVSEAVDIVRRLVGQGPRGRA